MMIHILIINHCVDEDLIFNINLVLSFNFNVYYSVCIWINTFKYNTLYKKMNVIIRGIFSLISYFKSFIYYSKHYEQSKRYFHDFISIAIKTKKVFWRNWADGSCIYVNNFISNSLYRTKAAKHNEKQLWFNTKKVGKIWHFLDLGVEFVSVICYVCFCFAPGTFWKWTTLLQNTVKWKTFLKNKWAIIIPSMNNNESIVIENEYQI